MPGSQYTIGEMPVTLPLRPVSSSSSRSAATVGSSSPSISPAGASTTCAFRSGRRSSGGVQRARTQAAKGMDHGRWPMTRDYSTALQRRGAHFNRAPFPPVPFPLAPSRQQVKNNPGLMTLCSGTFGGQKTSPSLYGQLCSSTTQGCDKMFADWDWGDLQAQDRSPVPEMEKFLCESLHHNGIDGDAFHL